MNKEPKELFAWQYVEKALRDCADISERSMVDFILLGDAAKAIREQKAFETDRIDMCMSRKQLTPEVRSNFKTWMFKPITYGEFPVMPIGYTWTYSPETLWHIKIPITLYVYDHYALFENPGRQWASTESFLLPNPFDKYWLQRHLVLGKLRKGSL